MVAAAVIGGAVVGAVGSGVAGSMAAGATKDASNAAISEQRAALEQQKELSAPYRAFGESAIPKLEQLLGLGPDGNAGIKQALESTPGYQFAMDQGQKGIANLASTQGGVSGNTLADLAKFNTGLAEGTYQQTIGNLTGAVNLGEASAAGTASNIGSAASNIGNIAVGAGNNLANIDAGTVAGITRSIGNAGDQYLTLQALQKQAA